MKSCLLTLSDAAEGRTQVQFAFSDFNRLRWAISAARHNPRLTASIACGSSANACLLDSNVLVDGVFSGAVPKQAHIVLWDGLNSLLELQARRPDLGDRGDLRYLYVGHFDDIDEAFPPGSQALFGNAKLLDFLGTTSGRVKVPWFIDQAASLRRRIRPWANRVQQPAKHMQLLAQPQLVFCGVVRPTSMVLDDMHRGGSLGTLHTQLQAINGLDWRESVQRTKTLVTQATTHLQQALPNAQTHADLAFLFAIHNLLHRIGTLTCIAQMGVPLFVNEFDIQPHFDPYDANAYEHNLYIDFGSTRGVDEVYPRTLDMLTTGKRCLPLRAIKAGERLGDTLRHCQSNTIWARCELDAKHASTALRQLSASAL